MPGTSTLNSNNTVRLHRKRCAGDGFSTNLYRATRICNCGTPHNLSLAIGRFLNTPVLLKLPSRHFFDRRSICRVDWMARRCSRRCPFGLLFICHVAWHYLRFVL